MVRPPDCGVGEKAACSYGRTETSVPLFSPAGGAGSSAVRVLSQHPRAEGASEDLSGPPADSPLPTPFSLIPPLSWREAALAEG